MSFLNNLNYCLVNFLLMASMTFPNLEVFVIRSGKCSDGGIFIAPGSFLGLGGLCLDRGFLAIVYANLIFYSLIKIIGQNITNKHINIFLQFCMTSLSLGRQEPIAQNYRHQFHATNKNTTIKIHHRLFY